MRSRFGSHRRLRHVGTTRVVLALALLMSAFPLLTAMQPAAAQDEQVTVGLITKTETNPFFVKMKEGAQAAADAAGAELLTAAGAFDGDNEGQVTALENMTTAGAQGILITPSDTKAIVPAIQAARDQGVLVIALKAGLLIGEYAKAVMGDTEPIIATIDGATGASVSALRHNGFLVGFGAPDAAASTPTADMMTLAKDPRVVCSQDADGDEAKSLTAMENCLQANPDINLVYTINEPTARGVYTALQAIGRENDVVIVSVDGGCTGVNDVKAGKIAATSQQYPLKMAQMGVDAVVNFVETGEAPSGYTDTGVTLITDEPVEGLESEDTTFGLENCWG
jgi:fructose transport system substrate-binding protein